MTVDDYLDKVQDCLIKANQKPPLPSYEEVLEAACWFIAIREASESLDALRLKDWARMIVEGEKVGGPYKTREDIEEWIKFHEEPIHEEGSTDTEEDIWDWLDPALDRHFGITRRNA